MQTQNNTIKSSTAALAFFMSAAAWIVSAGDLEAQVPEAAEPTAA